MSWEPRTPPLRPYVLGDKVMTLHPVLFDLLRQVALSYRPDDLEWCALLYGTRGPTGEVVQSVIVPRQTNHWGYYDVSADAMAAASASAGDHVLVGQVHAHPGIDVEHSRVDDAKAASLKILSFVLPKYGALLPSVAGLGVHEHQDGYWHLLEAPTLATRLTIDPAGDPPSFQDLR